MKILCLVMMLLLQNLEIDCEVSLNWSEWGNCKATCGHASRSSRCRPNIGTGRNCPNGQYRNQWCRNLPKCPISGGWSDWGQWNECSQNCIQNRTRTCTNPPQQYGGNDCIGNATMFASCNLTACKAL
ncbi:DgyrCDS14694 [Dimorphilus gyrociliatus]|uniref:DgyrCDS14694 n=1 Tax=Dimorphilus gyrociliatus TaxID=2664684 RepID=A0A7I8WER6_9ANNE|nr:DgyrCDS14694 [Dimorphilus gyrociliatus]